MPNIIKICPNIAKIVPKCVIYAWFTSKLTHIPPYLGLRCEKWAIIVHFDDIWVYFGIIWWFYVQNDPIYPIFAEEHPKIPRKPPLIPHICKNTPKMAQKWTKNAQKWPKSTKIDPKSKTFYHFSKTFVQNCINF